MANQDKYDKMTFHDIFKTLTTAGIGSHRDVVNDVLNGTRLLMNPYNVNFVTAVIISLFVYCIIHCFNPIDCILRHAPQIASIVIVCVSYCTLLTLKLEY